MICFISVFQYPAACGGVTVQFPLPWREMVRVRGYKKVYLLVIPRPLAAGSFIQSSIINPKGALNCLGYFFQLGFHAGVHITKSRFHKTPAEGNGRVRLNRDRF